jgi:demethylmenaquinone methyltransferase/2-methoxy-6-polyprenyl-1,4-benzoquinol methylase
VRNLSAFKPVHILDVATGTGDLAIALSRLPAARITGIDLAADMLAVAEAKVLKKGLRDRITFRQADAEAIPFPDASFDAVTVAFGVRNYEDLEKGLSEMRRVLRPGGIMMILEFSHPSSFPMKQAYRFYSRFIIPFIGRLISKNDQAYSYLPESVAAFPSGDDFLEVMHLAGMKNTSRHPLTSGISTIYKGEK